MLLTVQLSGGSCWWRMCCSPISKQATMTLHRRVFRVSYWIYAETVIFIACLCLCIWVQGRLICIFIFKNYWQLWCYLQAVKIRLRLFQLYLLNCTLPGPLAFHCLFNCIYTYNYKYDSYCTYANNKNYYPGYMCVLWPLSYSQGVTWMDRLQILRLLLQKVSLWREKNKEENTQVVMYF